MTDKVARFPPLPPQPEPPRFPVDERQRVFRGIVGGLVDSMGDGMGLGVANTAMGFPASAIDVGRLQCALEAGLVGFDMDVVRRRWEDDVRTWMQTLVLHWVQRCKSLRMEPRENGIHIELESQDDLGYYTY